MGNDFRYYKFMPVSDLMRSAEQEIDTSLSQLPIWRSARDNVLNATLDFYRGAYLTLSAITAQAAMSGGQESVTYVSAQLLQRLQAGCFQVLKWALLWCPEKSSQTFSDEMIHQAQQFGACYEALVDSLKLANHDLLQIVVDQRSRQVTVYEGGDVTGVDWSLVEHQRRSNLCHSHFSLTEDSDQLTRAWSAGAYRRTVSWLATVTAQLQEPVTFTQPSGDRVPLFPEPIVVRIPEPPDLEFQPVLDALTLTAARLTGSELWQHVSWLDTPLVALGAEKLGPSDLLVALAGIGREDHMLRLAAALDPEQYSSVSGLREERMIERCRQALEQEAWTVHPKYLLKHPTREVDIYAIRNGLHLVLELKSTLRPETPWEVHKRNQDILTGIAQARERSEQIDPGAIGVVITDGYRGDYVTWRSAIDHHIPIGTLEDIPDLAQDPRQVFDLLRARVGFESEPPQGAPFERSCSLVDWTLRLVDSTPRCL